MQSRFVLLLQNSPPILESVGAQLQIAVYLNTFEFFTLGGYLDKIWGKTKGALHESIDIQKGRRPQIKIKRKRITQMTRTSVLASKLMKEKQSALLNSVPQGTLLYLVLPFLVFILLFFSF